MIKILIADDDALIRDGLKVIFDLDDRFDVIAVAHNGQEAYEYCMRLEVDVALLDVRMPILNGVDATAKIVSESNTKVLILTTFDEDEFISKAFINGASGYLLKNNSSEQIKNAIFSVNDGNMVVQDVVMDQIRTNYGNKVNREKFEVLTQRELEVVELIADGLTNKEIADKLFISEGTVKNSVSNILSKLELKHRTQIAIEFLK